jgi:hypothetical protein
VATSNPTCPSYIAKKSDTVSLAAADFRAQEKHKKYVFDSNNFKFVCFSIESSGALNEEAMTLISRLNAIAHEPRDKFQFSDLACRFIARSFACSFAFAFLECIRKTLANTQVSRPSASPASSPILAADQRSPTPI